LILFKFFILGTLTALLFPPFFMLPLGFVIFPYFVNLICKINSKKTIFTLFTNGYVFGLGFFLIFLSWIYNPFLVIKATQPFAILAILLPVFLSIFFGLIFLIYKFYKDFTFIVFLTAFIFLFTEFLISNFLYGFPWFSYSLILSNNFLGFYLIKYFGTLTSSFLILSIFLLPICIINFKKFKKVNSLILSSYLPFLLVLFLPIIYLFDSDYKFNKKITLDIFQINSPIDKINKNKVEQNILKLIEQSDSDFIVFAENNYPYIISDTNYININQKIKNHQKVIIGSTREENGKFYNSFLFLEYDKIQYFDKRILVPFGEFLPLRKYLKFMENISGTMDFQRGKIDRILTSKEGIKIFPIICYEIIFDKIFKDINKYKIDFIINITNDSWFGNMIGPYQHFYLTRLKSLIANKPIVRVSNNGISAIIDQNGKIIKSSKLNKVSNLKHKLIIYNSVSYYMIHNLFSIYLFILFIIFLIFSRINNNEKK